MMPRPERPTIVSIRVHSILDENPDLSFYGEYGNSCTTNNCIDRQARGDRHSNYEYRYFNPATEYGELDYERMEDYERREWQMVGVAAEAEIRMPSGTTQQVRSGGLWGIESDSGSGYFNEVAEEELAQLRDELKAFGFTDAQIDAVEVDKSDLDAYQTHPYVSRRASRGAAELVEIERRKH